eukprot:21216-Chlamydomonas_euryale.AAC.20
MLTHGSAGQRVPPHLTRRARGRSTPRGRRSAAPVRRCAVRPRSPMALKKLWAVNDDRRGCRLAPAHDMNQINAGSCAGRLSQPTTAAAVMRRLPQLLCEAASHHVVVT